MDKKTLLIAQILMTMMMAASMSGIMTMIAMGPDEARRVWLQQFLTAWPIAFLLTQVVTRIAFPLALRLRRIF